MTGNDVHGGFGRGVGAGTLAAVAGAVGWAVITTVTNYKLGLVAIGIGLIVGLAIERAGGTDQRLPAAGAVLALVGCLLGDLLTDVHALAGALGRPFLDVLGRVLTDPGLTGEVFKVGFAPLDLIFYAIATYEGFKLSARGVARARAAVRLVASPEPVPGAAPLGAPVPPSGEPAPAFGTAAPVPAAPMPKAAAPEAPAPEAPAELDDDAAPPRQ